MTAVPTSDVAIYTPHTGGLYRRTDRRAGGAERQMYVLADVLARRGVTVAQIVYPVDELAKPLPEGLRLVDRGEHATGLRLVGKALEPVRILRALWRADGGVYVVRTAIPMHGLIGVFCKLRRRSLLFSAANNSDFVPEKFAGEPLKRWGYHLGIRLTTAVVVQSNDQLEMLGRVFPDVRDVTVIPSFADDPTPVEPGVERDTFVWIGRLVDYKQPEVFPRLAREVPEARFVMIPQLGDTLSASQRSILDGLEDAAATTPNLEVRRSLPRDELMPLVRDAVAVVNTSVFEGMPNVFLEAWSRGVPALTFQFDPDGVVAREGLGVSADGDWEAFAEGARALWAGRADRADLAARVQDYIRRSHSRDAVGAQWESVVRRIAPGRS